MAGRPGHGDPAGLRRMFEMAVSSRGLDPQPVRAVAIIDVLPIMIIDVCRGPQRAVVPVASSLLSRIVVPFLLVSTWRNGERADDLAQTLVDQGHDSVSSLNDFVREALPCSRYLRPPRDVDTRYTVG